LRLGFQTHPVKVRQTTPKCLNRRFSRPIRRVRDFLRVMAKGTLLLRGVCGSSRDCPDLERNASSFENGTRYVRHLEMTASRAEEPGKDDSMATSRTVLPAAATAAEAVPLTGQARRRIDPETGRALIVLGHAIEYLADEFAHEGGSFATHRGQVDAIQLLH